MKKIIRNTIFLIQKYIAIRIELKKLNLKNVKFFKFKNWHHGYCYFSAFSDNDIKVFIKIDTNLLILENELKAYNMLKNTKKIKLIKVLNFYKRKSMQIIIFEFLEANELTEVDIINNPLILLDIYNALISMSNKNIVHRDIRLENFLLGNNELYIIDFSFANHILECSNTLKELPFNEENYIALKGLGTRLNNIDFHWNDFYSMKEILEALLINQEDEIGVENKKIIQKYIYKFNSCIEGNTYLDLAKYSIKNKMYG
jgi:serine/threonine protein kinase